MKGVEMNAVVNLVQLPHRSKSAIIDELASALRNVKEDDFVKIVKALEGLSKNDMIRAWLILQDLKGVVESARDEIVAGAHSALWHQQRGY